MEPQIAMQLTGYCSFKYTMILIGRVDERILEQQHCLWSMCGEKHHKEKGTRPSLMHAVCSYREAGHRKITKPLHSLSCIGTLNSSHDPGQSGIAGWK